jgi:hypothetical protein
MRNCRICEKKNAEHRLEVGDESVGLPDIFLCEECVTKLNEGKTLVAADGTVVQKTGEDWHN